MQIEQLVTYVTEFMEQEVVFSWLANQVIAFPIHELENEEEKRF